MPLTHVCVWDGKAGYRRVSIEEACSMYPYTVAANRGIFVCSLCAQNVGLTAPGANVRHFRHTSAAQKKECEDRAQAYARASTGYNCHPMPLRIKVAHGSYSLELGFFHTPSSATSGPRCQKIIITDDNKQQHIYSFERLSLEGVTYLNVGNIPSTEYHLSYDHPSSNLDRYWPSKTTGINIRGSFFDCSTGKILYSGSKAYPYRDYYLLQRRSIGYVPHGISYESIAETRTGSFTTWYLSKRIIPIFHSISIYIIKSNITRIYRQDNRKRFIAVNINHLNCVAIIYFKLLHLLLIHRNKCSFIISLYSKLHNSSLNPRKSSTSTEKISEGKSWTIDIDGKRMVTQILRVRNICSHRAGNASIDRPIILNLLRRTNICLQLR